MYSQGAYVLNAPTYRVCIVERTKRTRGIFSATETTKATAQGVHIIAALLAPSGINPAKSQTLLSLSLPQNPLVACLL